MIECQVEYILSTISTMAATHIKSVEARWDRTRDFQGLPGEDGHLDPQQELLHLLQVLVQKQRWQELRALALQPAALLVADLQAKPAGGL